MNKVEFNRIYALNSSVKPISLETALRLTFGDNLPDGTLLYSEVGSSGAVRHLFIKDGKCYFEDRGEPPVLVCPSTALEHFYNQGSLLPELCSFAFCETLLALVGKSLIFTRFREIAKPFAPYAKDVSTVGES